MSESDEQNEAKASRRQALVVASCAGALGAGALLGPVGMALDPLLRGSEQAAATGPHAVGRLDGFTVGGAPQRVVLKQDLKDAWLVRREVPFGAVLVQRTSPSAFRVFSAVCPHLGCSVAPDLDGKGYNCPCHQSSFSLDGAVQASPTGGPSPSPRSLDPLPWSVEGDQLLVTWKRFKMGTPEREELA